MGCCCTKEHVNTVDSIVDVVPPSSSSNSNDDEQSPAPEPDDVVAPTLKPVANFNARDDCETLHEAMRGVGTNEAALINVLCHRSSQQRAEIVQTYQEMYQQNLDAKIREETSGGFCQVLTNLLKPTPIDIAAFELNQSSKQEMFHFKTATGQHYGFGRLLHSLIGPDTEGFVEILCSAVKNDQINELKQKYQQMFNKVSLEENIKNANLKSADLKELLLKLLSAGRVESGKFTAADVTADAKALNEAGEKSATKDAKPLIDILTNRRFAYLQQLIEAYKRDYKNDLVAVIQSRFENGDFSDGCTALLKSTQNKPAYFAERFRVSIAGSGASWAMVVRLITWRCEIDLQAIKDEYQRLYARSLSEDLAGRLDGDLKTAILSLLDE